MAIKKIGLLGGSFDPVHLGHTRLAETAREALALDELQLLPAANPWQRPELAASAGHRLAMLEIAIAKKSGLAVNPVEIERGGKTYTIDTLEQLPGDARYYWITGADQLANFCSWHRWEEIAARVRLVVAQRPGASAQAPAPLQKVLARENAPLISLPFEATAISATDIRHRLARGLPVDGMLDDAVAQYIRRHGLYKPAASQPIKV